MMAAGVDYFHKERLGASLTSDCGDWFAEVYRIRLRHKIARAAAKDLLQRRPQKVRASPFIAGSISDRTSEAYLGVIIKPPNPHAK